MLACHLLQIKLTTELYAIWATLVHWRVAAPSCETSIQGMALRGHTYNAFASSDIQACYHSCRRDESCQSINYYTASKTCQFNNRTSDARPAYFARDKGASYFRNPFRATLGSSRKTPAISCSEIKQNSREPKSGVYWVRVAGLSAPIRVYCDMRAEVDGCRAYRNLTEADRNQNYSKKSRGYPKCDGRILEASWYRFTGEAGDMMATKCVPKYRCNTHAAGWISGHPSEQEGVVTKTVCFHWSTSCCYFKAYVRVKNCGAYYVYYFKSTPSCSLRYCGNWG